jgi:probable phosphoglycerate mutase
MGHRGMMTKLYLIRHAEAEGNLYRIIQGHHDGLITDRGYQQIRALEKRFLGIPIDAVYSSDLFRTRTTARAIYVPKHLPLHTTPQLREVFLGGWEGHTWEEINRTDPINAYNFNHLPGQYKSPGGEAPADAQARELAALRAIVAENPGKTVAVVSHGDVLRLTLGALQGLTLDEIGQTPYGDNTCVSYVEAEGEQMRVVWRDDASHLDAENLSTFARQNWWKKKRGNAAEERYAPLTADDPFYRACLRAAEAENGIAPDGGSGEIIGVWSGKTPVGVLRLDTGRSTERIGWIGFYYLVPEARGCNFGIPPLGQAVFYYRARGCDRLRMTCRKEEAAAASFFMHFGFSPIDGTDILEKYIGYEERT